MIEERHNLHTQVYFASIASTISLVLSFFVILRYNYRSNLNIDYLGIIVAIVSLAVAVFVGVQIYQSFNLRKDIEKQNQAFVDKIRNEIPNIEEVKKQLEEQTSIEIKRIKEEYIIDISGLSALILQLSQRSDDVMKTAFNIYSMNRKNLSKLFSYKLIIGILHHAKTDINVLYSFMNDIETSDLKRFISEYSKEENADFELISKISEYLNKQKQ